MIGFNAFLRDAGIDPTDVRLVRHQDTRFGTRASPYQAWLAEDGRLEVYQRIQRRPIFDGARLLASFVGTPPGETLFIGLFEVGSRSFAPPGMLDPLTGQEVEGFHLYDLTLTDLLAPYRGKLVIDWGLGFRSWVQRADHRDKPVLELRRLISEPPFPGFINFIERLSELPRLPASWRTALSSVSGVYILVCPDTGQRYVGSAYGAGGFWARWDDYVRNGHGGNIGMRELPPSDYQVAILEVAPSSAMIDDIIAMEARWKRKLLTLQFGLNRN